VALIQRKREAEVRRVKGRRVLRGPRQRSERRGGMRRPGRLVAFRRVRSVMLGLGGRCRVVWA